jgi:hypothetical protein
VRINCLLWGRLTKQKKVVIGIALLLGGAAKGSEKDEGRDVLYIGDGNDTGDPNALHSTVKRFDATTGKYLGVFIEPIRVPIPNSSSSYLDGPRGLIVNHQRQLLVVNQNEHQDYAGEVFAYTSGGSTGVFLRAIVPHVIPGSPKDLQNPAAQFVPRGTVLSHKYLFVASQVGDEPNGNGSLRAYDPQSGVMRQALPIPDEFASGDFHPDGLVIYHGLLYVTNRRMPPKSGGEILRYHLDSLTLKDVFIRSNSENDLLAPEGLVFGPDGNIYVVSYRATSTDTDKMGLYKASCD